MAFYKQVGCFFQARKIDYSSSSQKIIIPAYGTYQISLYGSDGQDYGNYSGGAGGGISFNILLNIGDELNFYTGGQNSVNGGSGALSKGGDATYLTLNGSIIAIAGGGGGAGKIANGGAGGKTLYKDSSFVSSCAKGASSSNSYTCGGGGGYTGGSYGYVVYHSHTGACQSQTGTRRVERKGSCNKGSDGWSCNAPSGHCAGFCSYCGGHWGYCGGDHSYDEPVYSITCGKNSSTIDSSVVSGGGGNFVTSKASQVTSYTGVNNSLGYAYISKV